VDQHGAIPSVPSHNKGSATTETANKPAVAGQETWVVKKARTVYYAAA
jgi:hypothetical protein